jgi:hypothetical protein
MTSETPKKTSPDLVVHDLHQEINLDVVFILEEALEQAKRGEIRAISIACLLSHPDYTSQSIAVAGDRDRLRLIGLLQTVVTSISLAHINDRSGDR